jgi:hypothetical protein
MKRRDNLEDLGVRGVIILKWIVNKQYARMWFGFFAYVTWLMDIDPRCRLLRSECIYP